MAPYRRQRRSDRGSRELCKSSVDPISCTDFAGDPLDAVEEAASGASGLQYVGDGYWGFNWKTPKNYAESCRAMYVEFNSGALSPVVKFQFKK